MFLKKRAQSTAEYAITFGLVIALAAGVLSVGLKGGIRQKEKQAMNYMLKAGNDTPDFNDVEDQDVSLYSSERRQTTVMGGDANYIDDAVMVKGGASKKKQLQTTESTATSIEAINALNTTTP